MTARERVEMNARETVEVMVRTSRGSMTVWSVGEVRDALDALEQAVAARTREQVAQEIETTAAASKASTLDRPRYERGGFLNDWQWAAQVARDGTGEQR